MDAKEYLKLSTDKSEAGELIKENNLTEAVIKLMNGYADFKMANSTKDEVANKINYGECVRINNPELNRCLNCGAKAGHVCRL